MPCFIEKSGVISYHACVSWNPACIPRACWEDQVMVLFNVPQIAV